MMCTVDVAYSDALSDALAGAGLMRELVSYRFLGCVISG